MTSKVTVETRAFGNLADRINAIAKRVADPSPELKSLASDLEAEIKSSIVQQRGMNGEPWPPKKGGGKALQSVASDVFVESTKDSITFGVRGPGVYHQFGSARLPRRPFLPLDQQGRPSFVAGSAKAWLDRARARLLDFWLGR